jgi:hypothetical protein
MPSIPSLFSANDIWTAVGSLAAILTMAAAVAAFSYALGFRSGRSLMMNERARRSLNKIYAPLVALFLEVHPTTSTIAGRWAHVQIALSRRPRRRSFMSRVRSLLRAVGPPYGVEHKIHAEIEYGGNFPLGKITGLVTARAHHADLRLILLINRANRSQHERESNDLLTDEEWALYLYIDKQHRKLCKKLGLG